MPLVWTTELNTGIRIIDLQHQELVELINELEGSIPTQSSLAALRPMVLRLKQYVLFHFSHEEGLMQRKQIDSAHLKAHFAEHKHFAEQVDVAIAALERSDQPDVAVLVEFLKTWLVKHIMGTDKTVAKLLTS
jgi:hemerythrin